jgi:molybdopterin adenylyltransferase
MLMTEKQDSPSEAHKDASPTAVRIAILTVSSSRTISDDVSGGVIKDIARAHTIVKHIVIKDNAALIRNEIRDTILDSFNPVDAIIVNGGTGLSKTDVTIEALRPLFEKELTGFNSLVMCMSFESIGSAALLSRATAGIIRSKIVFCMPGSPEACQLVMEKLIMPEIGHIVKHLND